MKTLTFEIKKIPDLYIQKYTNRYGGEVVSKVLERQQEWLTLLHELSEYAEIAPRFTLSFSFSPANTTQPLVIYFTVSIAPTLDGEKVKNLLLSSPVAEFYQCELVDAIDLDRERLEHCVSIIKEEQLIKPLFKEREAQQIHLAKAGLLPMTAEQVSAQYKELKTNPFYYIPMHVVYPFEPLSDNDMLGIDRTLSSFNVPALIEITLQPCEISSQETQALQAMLNHLDKISSFSLQADNNEQKFVLRGDWEDKSAESVQDIFEQYYEELTTKRCFEFAIRVWASDELTAQFIADQLVVHANGNGRYKKILLNSEQLKVEKESSKNNEITFDVYNEEIWSASWQQPFLENSFYEFNQTSGRYGAEKYKHFGFVYQLKRLARLTTLDNIAPFFRLPIPSNAPLQTMFKETDGAIGNRGEKLISIGADVDKPLISHQVPLMQLNKHMFISGVPGSGKTTAVFNILAQLFENDIPFLVFEPAKTEYRLLKCLAQSEKQPTNPGAQSLGEKLQVYTLGQEHISPLLFNPLEFPLGISLNEHLSSLESSFKGAMPISVGPLPALINEAVDNCYEKLGWYGSKINDGSLPYPCFNDLYQEIQRVFEVKSYSGDTRGDLQTAIEVRLGALMRRAIGVIFDTDASFPSIEKLMQSPCVIELDALNEEQTNLIIMFLLSQIRAYIRANRQSGGELKHVIVLEEAHNIVGKTQEASDDGGNPKTEATKYIIQFLAEVRALGEGVIIADQLPSAVAPEVIKNTNIKMAHRMVAADDREELGMTMLADSNQFEEMARLAPGEAFLYQEGMYKPVKVKGHYLPNTYPILAQSPPSNSELKALVINDNWHLSVSYIIAERSIKRIIDSLLELACTAQERRTNYQSAFTADGANLKLIEISLKKLAQYIDDYFQQMEHQFSLWERLKLSFSGQQIEHLKSKGAVRELELTGEKATLHYYSLVQLQDELLEVSEMLPNTDD